MGAPPFGWLPPPYSSLILGQFGPGSWCYTGLPDINHAGVFDLGLVNGGGGSPFDPPGKEVYLGFGLPPTPLPVGTKFYGLLTPTLRLDVYNNFAAPPPPPTDAYLWLDFITSPWSPLTLTWSLALALGSIAGPSVLIVVGVPGSGSAQVKGIMLPANAPVVFGVPVYGFRLRCVPIGAVFPDNAGLFLSFSVPPPDPNVDSWSYLRG